MNIIDALTSGIHFEIKISNIYKRILFSQGDHPDFQKDWKEIISQKEKQIHLLKKARQAVQNHSPNSSRIQLVSSKNVEEGLNWINQTEKEFNTVEPVSSKVVELIHPIVSFELQNIYSPLFKIYDLLIIKKEPQLGFVLTRHLQALNRYLIKHRAPSLTELMKNYTFLSKKGDEKPGFREDEVYQKLINQKKIITLRLKNGALFKGTLDGFDHFSLKCRPLDSATSPASTLFLKESIISVQLND